VKNFASEKEPLPPVGDMLRLLSGFITTQAIHAAARLGVADLLADGPKRVEELATTTAAHAPSLRRLLRYLASIEVIYEDADGRFFSRSNMTKRAGGAPNHFKFSLVGVVFERSLDLLVMTRGLAKVLTSTILSDNAYASKSAGIGVSTKSSDGIGRNTIHAPQYRIQC
jgi:hypothetical protein